MKSRLTMAVVVLCAAGCATVGREAAGPRPTAEEAAAIREVRARLERPVSLKIEDKDATLLEAVQALGRQADVAFLSDGRLRRQSLPSVDLKDVPLRKALDRLIGDSLDLAFTVTPYGILIGPSEEVDAVAARGGLLAPIEPTTEPPPVRSWLIDPPTDEERRIERILRQPVSFDFDKKPVRPVFEEIARKCGIRIVQDQEVYATEGIADDTVLMLKVRDIPLASALALLLEQLNLDYVVRDNALVITDYENACADLVTRVYEIRDFVPPDNVCNARVRDMPSGDHLFRSWDDAIDGDDTEAERMAAEEACGCAMCGLMAAIRNATASWGWASYWLSGHGASVVPLGNRFLVIQQTPRAHEQVARFLARLRDLERRQRADARARPPVRRVYRFDLDPPETIYVRRLRRQLLLPVSVTFKDTPFGEAIDTLREKTGANIVLDWRALLVEGVDLGKTVVERDFHRVSAGEVLGSILEQVNLEHGFFKDVIYVTDAVGDSRDLDLVFYGVHGLLASIDPAAAGDSNEMARLRTDLQRLIMTVVSPESWLSGSISAVREDVLLIAQTKAVHRHIWEVLNELCRIAAADGRPAAQANPTTARPRG